MGAAMIIAAQLTGGRDQLAIPALVLALAMGAGVGLLTGLLVTKRRVPPFVATLAMLGARRRRPVGVHERHPEWQYPAIAGVLGRDALGPFPVALLVMVGIAAVGGLLLYQRHSAGRCTRLVPTARRRVCRASLWIASPRSPTSSAGCWPHWAGCC